MIKHTARVTICTMLCLIFTLEFGYAFSVIREIKGTDFYYCSAKNIGSSFYIPEEDESLASDKNEIESAKIAKGVICRSLKESEILNGVSIDYKNKIIIAKVLTNGTVDALNEDNDEKWQDICETGRSCSKSWAESLAESGLEEWHFSIVILNDYYPKNALLICTDGNVVYNCCNTDPADTITSFV